MSDETLKFPCQIADELGVSPNKLNAYKKQGCPFIGRKTSVWLVRNWLYRSMAVESSLPPLARPQRSGGNKPDALAAKNDSRGASLVPQKALHDGNE